MMQVTTRFDIFFARFDIVHVILSYSYFKFNSSTCNSKFVVKCPFLRHGVRPYQMLHKWFFTLIIVLKHCLLNSSSQTLSLVPSLQSSITMLNVCHTSRCIRKCMSLLWIYFNSFCVERCNKSLLKIHNSMRYFRNFKS